MRITTSKSKNSESFYITKSYTNANGKSTSKTIRKLGTLAELSAQLHTDRDGVVKWANEQARLETLKYKSEKKDATVMIPFHSNLSQSLKGMAHISRVLISRWLPMMSRQRCSFFGRTR